MPGLIKERGKLTEVSRPFTQQTGNASSERSFFSKNPTDAANDAIKLLGEQEGIILDPVYTGKAMAGMIDMIKNKSLENARDVVFLHTGGAPAIHTFADLFLDKENKE